MSRNKIRERINAGWTQVIIESPEIQTINGVRYFMTQRPIIEDTKWAWAVAWCTENVPEGQWESSYVNTSANYAAGTCRFVFADPKYAAWFKLMLS